MMPSNFLRECARHLLIFLELAGALLRILSSYNTICADRLHVCFLLILLENFFDSARETG